MNEPSMKRSISKNLTIRISCFAAVAYGKSRSRRLVFIRLAAAYPARPIQPINLIPEGIVNGDAHASGFSAGPGRSARLGLSLSCDRTAGGARGGHAGP